MRIPSPIETICLLAISLSRASAQNDDFNDGNDSGWTRFAPLQAAGGTSFSFPDAGYRMSCQPSPDPGTFGPSRAGSLRMDKSYVDFCVMVDVLDWNPAEDSAMGILARIQPGFGPGTLNAYAFTYQAQDHDVEINKIVAENPSRIGNGRVTLETGHSYRFVFFGVGGDFVGRIYDLASPLIPVVEARASDADYESGGTGLVIFSDSNTATSATFDNFSASSGQPPPLQASPSPDGKLEVSWSTLDGLCAYLQSSTDLTTWAAPTGLTQTSTAGRTAVTITPAGTAEFFRLKFGLPP